LIPYFSLNKNRGTVHTSVEPGKIIHGELDGLLRSYTQQLWYEATVQTSETLMSNHLVVNSNAFFLWIINIYENFGSFFILQKHIQGYTGY
jgi:hypothetical protein